MAGKLSFLLLLLLLNSVLFAHEVTFKVVSCAPAIIVQAEYSAAEPVAYADVRIYSPESLKTGYQNGHTDIAGYFAFVPDQAGTWTFSIDDGLGHLAKTTVTVSPDFFTSRADSILLKTNQTGVSVGQIPLHFRVIFGFALILAVTGFSYGLKARKLLRKNAR